MTGVKERAERRFAGLRKAALGSPEVTGTGAAPDGLCLSVIARLITNSADTAEWIAALQQRALSVGGDQYQYPAESLHLSILGCTQREPTAPSSDQSRLAAIGRVVREVIIEAAPIRVHLGRPNLIGNQLFVDAVTDSTEWSVMRLRLAEQLLAIGESPISYADPEPLHLNIGRFTSQPDMSALRAFLVNEAGIQSTVVFSVAELVLTDFVVSPSVLQILDRIPFLARRGVAP